jgi:hypothetical protein
MAPCAPLTLHDALCITPGFPLTTRESLPYQLKSALVLQRVPSITPDRTEWEQRYEAYVFQKHLDNEAMQRTVADVDRMIREQSSKKELKKAKKDVDAKDHVADAADSHVARSQRAAALDDLRIREAQAHAARFYTLEAGDRVVLGSRITAADKANDRHSMNRALASRVYLIVKRAVPATPAASSDRPLCQIANDGLPLWHFPHADWIEGQSLRKVRVIHGVEIAAAHWCSAASR